MQVKYKISLVIIWVVCSIISIKLLTKPEIATDMLSKKEGVSQNAQCITSRSLNGVKFNVKYKNETDTVEDYFSMPPNFVCNDDLIKNFDNKKIIVLHFNNKYYDITINNIHLKLSDNGVTQFSKIKGTLTFVIFIAIISTIMIYYKCRNANKSSI